MADDLVVDAVDEDPRGRGGQKDGHPLAPPPVESKMAWDLKEEGP